MTRLVLKLYAHGGTSTLAVELPEDELDVSKLRDAALAAAGALRRSQVATRLGADARAVAPSNDEET